MTEKIRITVTGRYGATDGYVETILGSLALAGVLKSHNLSREWENGKTDTIHIDAEMLDLPLGHLGVEDIPLSIAGDKRRMAIAQAFDVINMLRDEPYVVLDTETTGLERGEIVQIAVLDHLGHALMYHYVKPVGRIPLDATNIHGITNAMVADAPNWKQTSDELLSLISGKNVVIYNAVYDRKMMHQSAEAAGLPPVIWKERARFWCAMETYACVAGDWNEYKSSFRWQKLASAAQHYSIEVAAAHDALGDCMTTLALCKHLALVRELE